MKVTRVEQRTSIKIAVLCGRNEVECHSEFVGDLENKALPYRTVARWVGKFQQGCVSTSDEQSLGTNAQCANRLGTCRCRAAHGRRQTIEIKKTDREAHNTRIVISTLCVLCCHFFAP
ncbi:uncharacterized protein TNCT_486801 [Trichonephila clavata]|uniref:Mos1 transposase HTH domain-containing protein n=1 Tax=Trichonephila clavata TaxID=2740835 RepID=A0A8X6J2E1_TRICU|nr:uncharacterized protein TNCT_486801 [Trichonephila clavata]